MDENSIRKYNDLEQAILKTLAFFDIFDYPLTLVEVYKWLYAPSQSYQLFEINQALEQENLKNIVDCQNGFYFFTGRNEIINTRLKRYQIAEKKFAIALKTIYWLRQLAFIEMIAICNNVGYNNAAKASDIDFFIVVKNKRLWYSRLVITLVASLLGIRRHGQKIADRVCLSFYVADDHLNLADIALAPLDPYLTYWFATLAPVYDAGIYRQFLAANNELLKKYLPNFYPTALNSRRIVLDNAFVKFCKRLDESVLGGTLGSRLESWAKFFELKKMKKHTFGLSHKSDTKVVINDFMLKFHENDRRQDYYNLWQKKLSRLGI